MIYKNEEEKKIYEAGFWAGRNSQKSKSNYTQEEIEEIKTNLNLYLEAQINGFAEDIDKIYLHADWLRRIPILKKYIEKKEELLKDWESVRNFLSYIQTKMLPEYLDHINTRKEK